MKKETIAAVLASEGVSAGKSAPQTFTIAEDRDAACFVRAGADTVTVARVVRIELRDDFLMLEAGKGERYFFGFDDLVGLRLMPEKKERAAGFGR